MVATCCMCSGNITKERFPGLKCGGLCDRPFHAKCAGISDQMLQGVKNRSVNWVCEECRSTTNQSMIDCDDDTSDIETIDISLVDIMKQLKRMEKNYLLFKS